MVSAISFDDFKYRVITQFLILVEMEEREALLLEGSGLVEFIFQQHHKLTLFDSKHTPNLPTLKVQSCTFEDKPFRNIPQMDSRRHHNNFFAFPAEEQYTLIKILKSNQNLNQITKNVGKADFCNSKKDLEEETPPECDRRFNAFDNKLRDSPLILLNYYDYITLRLALPNIQIQMNKSYLLVTLLLLVAPLVSQQIRLTEQELSNAALLTQLNNYFGCKVWSDDACLECSERYFFNSKGVCCEVQGTCQQFNTKEGICQKCYEGYSVVDGKCATVSTTTQENIGCASWKGGVCTQCSKRWYFNSQRTCVPISDLCSTWNDETGACQSCYYGYIVSEGVCVVNNDLSVVPNSNLLCKTWSGSTCIECAARTFANQNGICTSVSEQCTTFDKATGQCLTCFDGYDLAEGNCIFSPSNTASPSDLGCASWDWKSQKCLACSNRWAFNELNICVPVADQCASSDNAGLCASCYKGYDLKDGQCLYSLSNDAKPADLGCGTWDWDNQVCLKCSNGWVFNADKVCVAVSDLCSAHNENGDCTECFKGYDLKEGKCVFSESNNAKPSDLGCGSWDWDNQVCLKCSSGWVINADRVCVPVSDQCRVHSENGDCTDCFKGYDLQEGKCVFSESNNAKPSDSGCATWDWDNQKCLKCSSRWTFNGDGICVPVSDQCKTHTDNGECSSCFRGYDLKDGQCLFSESNNAKPSDSGCATWDWENQVCLKCSNRWTFNSDKVCVPVSDQCKTHSENGDCQQCFQGYDLKEGKCIFSESNNAKPSDSGCATWDWNNQKCLKCSSRWTFNGDGICVPVSDQCKTHAENGNCQSCFQGYDLKDGQCLFSESNNAKPSDSGCGTWDWNNQICLKCSSGWVFNDRKICVAVSDLCRTSADNGDCTSCFEGYDLKEGQCVFSQSNNARPSDLGCATWDWKNQVCLKCSNRWFFNAKQRCVPVDDNCNTYSESGSCTSCYQGYSLSDGVCVSVNPLCRTLNADGTCASCYPQNILHKGNCVPISKLANILLYYAECCPEKLQAIQAAQAQSGN